MIISIIDIIFKQTTPNNESHSGLFVYSCRDARPCVSTIYFSAYIQFISVHLSNLFICKHQSGSIIIHHNHLVAVNGSGNQLFG